MLNSYYGVYQAIVTNIDDPEKRGRLKVQCPSVLGVNAESAWCDPCVPVAYDNGGDFCLPRIREAVWLMFIGGDVNKPVYMGGWWSKYKTPLGDNYTDLEDIRIIGYNDCSVVMGDDTIDLRAKKVKINGVPYSSSGGSSEEVLTAISEFREEFRMCCAGMQESIERLKQELLTEIRGLKPDTEIVYKGSIAGNSVLCTAGAISQSHAGTVTRGEIVYE